MISLIKAELKSADTKRPKPSMAKPDGLLNRAELPTPSTAPAVVPVPLGALAGVVVSLLTAPQKKTRPEA
jgi:Na+(H+)/acetate symporter ActP